MTANQKTKRTHWSAIKSTSIQPRVSPYLAHIQSTHIRHGVDDVGSNKTRLSHDLLRIQSVLALSSSDERPGVSRSQYRLNSDSRGRIHRRLLTALSFSAAAALLGLRRWQLSARTTRRHGSSSAGLGTTGRPSRYLPSSAATRRASFTSSPNHGQLRRTHFTPPRYSNQSRVKGGCWSLQPCICRGLSDAFELPDFRWSRIR
jgi:hypothetical protein